MEPHDLVRFATGNNFEISGKVWLSPFPGGGNYITPRPGETVKVVAVGGSTQRIVPTSQIVMWLDAQNHFCQIDRPPVPALTKSQGMALAYTSADREQFEALLYEICRNIDPGVVFSSDDVWREWRARGWPDPKNRAFVGPTMGHGEKSKWMQYMHRVENTMVHSHSSETNRGYRSLISKHES